MKKKIIFSIVLIVAMAMTTVFGALAANETTYDAAAIKKKYLESSYASEKEKLATMTLEMTSGKYMLYIEETTGEMALRNGDTGQILWSNPYDAASQEIAETQKYELMSQVLLNYTTISSGAAASMNSFEEAAMRINETSGINQIQIKKISSGVRVEYTMGRTETRFLVPVLISAERFEELILEPLKEAAKLGLSTSDGKYTAAFLLSKFYNTETGKSIFYTLKDPNAEDVTERQKRAMYLQYPITEKMAVYALDSKTTSVEKTNWLEKAITNFTNYTYEDLAYDHSLTNYTGTDVAPPLFRLAIEYYLDDNGLTYRIPANGIRFDSTLYRLTDLTILPYLGAGSVAAGGGYTFIPDGSGAIIDFKDVEGMSLQLSGKIYGQDYSYYNLTGANQEIMRLPVFGTISYKSTTTSETTYIRDENGEIVYDENGNPQTETKTVTKTNNAGVLSIIEEGEAIGTITSKHGGTVNPYNTTFATYVPRPNDSYALTQFSEASTSMWTVVTDRRYTGNITVRVLMLSGDDASYSGMANAYREYLVAGEKLKKLESTDKDIPLFIESFGAIEVTERIAGVPVNVKKALTSYDDLKTIVSELRESGVGEIDFKYSSWANDCFDTKPFSKLKIESATGGKKGLLDFVEFAKENNVQLYPDVDLTYVYNVELFDGFDYNKWIARKVDKRMASKRLFDDEFQGLMLWGGDVISPQFMDTVWSKIEKKYTNLDIGGISLNYLGSDLNSDQSKKRPLNRVESQGYVTAILAKVKESVGSVMIDGGNAYAFAYADVIVDAPIESSRYVYASKEIPFYGMVVHGNLKFAGEPLNSAANYTNSVLKTIESGAMPFFRVSYENTNELKQDFTTSKYFSVDYKTWKDDIVKTYTEINSVLCDLQNVYIVNHQTIGYKTVCVTYENGVEIFVNYDRNKVGVYKDGDGNYQVSYEISDSGKCVVRTVEMVDGEEVENVEEFDTILTLEGNSYVKRGDK